MDGAQHTCTYLSKVTMLIIVASRIWYQNDHYKEVSLY